MSEPTPDPSPIVSLDELKTFLRMTVEPDDAETLQDVLDAAIDVVDSRVGGLLAGTRTYRVYPARGALLIPPGLREVSTITDPDGNPVALDDVDVDLEAGILTPLAGHITRGRAWTVVAGSADRDTSSLALAVKIIAAHLWQVQTGSPSGARRIGGQDMAEAQQRMGFAIPARATQLIADFIGPGGFA